jgi:hypothetical protein
MIYHIIPSSVTSHETCAKTGKAAFLLLSAAEKKKLSPLLLNPKKQAAQIAFQLKYLEPSVCTMSLSKADPG